MDCHSPSDKAGMNGSAVFLSGSSEGKQLGSAGDQEKSRGLCASVVALRALGVALTLVAALVAALNKETEDIPLTLNDSAPPIRISADAKWYYLSSTVYFVVSNSIACAYAAASVVLYCLTKGSGSSILTLVLYVLDQIMVALLFSANGASAAIGMIALRGNSHVQWHKVCHIFKRYCNHSVAAVVTSALASVVFLSLVLTTALDLHRRSWARTRYTPSNFISSPP